MKKATFYKSHKQLFYWLGKNTATSIYCKGIKQARMVIQRILVTDGVIQELEVQ